MKIEIFLASMLPPAKRERGGGGKNCFCVFVYFIYSTTLLMHGIVKKNLLHDQTVYIYIYLLCRHEHDSLHAESEVCYLKPPLYNFVRMNPALEVIFCFISNSSH
jgi:hypothetical protein